MPCADCKDARVEGIRDKRYRMCAELLIRSVVSAVFATRVPMLRARNSLSIDAVAKIARKRASAICTYENINYLNGTPYMVDYLIVNYPTHPSPCRDRNIIAYCIIICSLCASKHMTHRAAGLRIESLTRKGCV